MARRYFEEIQLLRQNRWIWYILIVLSALLVAPILHGMYTQLITGEPWGDEPMSDNGLIIFSCAFFLSWAMITWLLYSIRLEVYIDQDGVHYKFFPNKASWNVITKRDIVSYEIRRTRNLLETGGFGYHRNLFRKSQSMVIRGSKHIRFMLPGKRKLLIGTQNPEEFDRALRRLLSNHLTE